MKFTLNGQRGQKRRKNTLVFLLSVSFPFFIIQNWLAPFFRLILHKQCTVWLLYLLSSRFTALINPTLSRMKQSYFINVSVVKTAHPRFLFTCIHELLPELAGKSVVFSFCTIFFSSFNLMRVLPKVLAIRLAM